MAKKKEDKVYSILTSIDDTLKKQSSTKRVFVQGLVRGFGTALGATVLVALATSVTFKFLESIDAESFSEALVGEAVPD